MAHRHGHRRSRRDASAIARVGGLILAGTLALTLAVFGVVAIATASTRGIGGRLPFYVLGMAVVFVVGIIGIEQHVHRPDANRVLWAASVFSLGGFVFLLLAGEGLLYAARNADTVLAAERVLYMVAIGFIGTGVGYWGLRNWPDLKVRLAL